METQTCQTDCLFLLTVYSPYVSYADSVCFFTDYERALNVKDRLQEKIEAFITEQQEYWKDRTFPITKYITPVVVVVKVPYSESDNVQPMYVDIIRKNTNVTPLQNLPSSGPGCWFDFLKSEQRNVDEKSGALCESLNDTSKVTQTMFQALYVVTDYFLGDDFLQSQVVGVFTDPSKAHDVQTKVAKNYGLDVLYNTYNDEHFIELVGFTDGKKIDPVEVNFHRMNIST